MSDELGQERILGASDNREPARADGAGVRGVAAVTPRTGETRWQSSMTGKIAIGDHMLVVLAQISATSQFVVIGP